MKTNTLPFGTQFSPTQIDIIKMKKILKKCENGETNTLVEELAKAFFHDKDKKSQKAMAGNCKNSLVSYGILAEGGGVHITEFGEQIIKAKTIEDIYENMAKHILKDLNGMILINVIRQLNRDGVHPTNETVIEALNTKGIKLSKTSNNAEVMKLWLEKANVMNKWAVNEVLVERYTGISEEEFKLLKQLSPEQYYFLKALCNTAATSFQKASEVRKLASATYGIKFQEKSFANKILNPLSKNDFIEVEKSTEGRGGLSHLVKISNKTKAEILTPILDQVETLIGKELAEYYQQPLEILYKEINSKNTYKKGLALEAFAIKVMSIIGLNFIKTRLKGNETGGAEVDVLFDSTQLLYSRWQVQCKNIKTVSVDQIAKEVGLAIAQLNSNAIVIMTTGKLSDKAREYANSAMKQLNICIIAIEGNDIKQILSNPTSIIEIFNREAKNAQNIKVFNE